jgi:hypothetical protein
VPHRHRAESEKLFRFFARERRRRAEQKVQKLASRLDGKLTVRRQYDLCGRIILLVIR